MDPDDEIPAAAAKFSSLSTNLKQLLVTSLNYTSYSYRGKYVQLCREKKINQSEWKPSYLRIKDFMLLGDMDREEAKKSCKEPFYPEKFELRLLCYENKRLEALLKEMRAQNAKDEKEGKDWSYEPPDLTPMRSAESYNGEYFVDTPIRKSVRVDDDKKDARRKLLDPERRKDMLAQVESRREKLQKAMNKRVARKERMPMPIQSKTNKEEYFNKSDDEKSDDEDKGFNIFD